MSLRLGTTLIAGLTELSEMANTDLSNLSATGQAVINGKASTSLSNLTDIGKNIGNWSTNISNCITEIPQNIKLELSNGAVTLKAGSKVYVPNGFEQDGTTPKFEEVIIDEDIISNSVSGTKTCFISYDPDRDAVFVSATITSCGSGTENPSSGTGYFYNTSTNIIDYRSSGAYEGRTYAFPLGIVTITSDLVTSIDQVFNGFGYIGSTIFALSGVKGLIPNGLHSNGTAKSIAWETSSVITRTFSSSDNYTPAVIVFTGSTYGRWNVTDYIYHLDTNKMDTLWGTYLGTITLTSGVISNWNILNQVFHAIDFRDSSTISSWVMPSDKYENLTLGATGTLYTAPASGYFSLQKVSGSDNKYIALQSKNMQIRVYSTGTGSELNCWVPVGRGQKIAVYYNATGATNFFKFIYAKGDE